MPFLESTIEGDPAIGHAMPCPECGGSGVGERHVVGHARNRQFRSVWCRHCDGVGWIGIDPRAGTTARPGSNEKIAVLAARCRAELPLIHDADDAASAASAEQEPTEWSFDDAP